MDHHNNKSRATNYGAITKVSAWITKITNQRAETRYGMALNVSIILGVGEFNDSLLNENNQLPQNIKLLGKPQKAKVLGKPTK